MGAGRGLSLGGTGGGVTTLTSGTGITVDNTNPAAPIINWTGDVSIPATVVSYYTDFTEVTASATDHWVGGVNSGTGASSTQQGASGNKMGIRRITSGTDTTGIGTIASSPIVIEPANGTLLFESLVRIPLVSDGTETFTTRVGFYNTIAGITDQICFRYTHSVNTGKFQAVTMKATTETAQDTLQTVVADTWYKLRVEVNAAATSATFYINDVLTNTIATNIPNTSTNIFGFGAGIFKSAGTTARTLDVDYYKFISVLTVPR